MFRKFGVITAMATTLVIGGGLSSVDAAPDTSQSTNLLDSMKQANHDEGVDAETKQNGHDNVDQLLRFKDNSKSDNDKDDESDKEANRESKDQSQESEKSKDKASNNNEGSEEQQESDKQDDESDQKTEGLSEFEQEVVDLTNEEREKQGLSPLKADTELSEVARDKSKDMNDNNYFSHDSPNYGSPFDMLESYDVDYQTAGENIARGQPSPEEVVDGWMDSEGHRENILKEDFTHIGVGHVEDGNYWTQEFTG